jgi:hypothetical protein
MIMNKIKEKQLRHQLGWWLEILTAQPMCLYYFGVFDTHKEAESCQAGFIEDLLQENALIFSSSIQYLQPSQTTLTGDDLQSHMVKLNKLGNPRNRAILVT